MKQILFSLILLSASVCGLSAQKTLEKGTVTMKVVMDGPMAGLVGESTVTTHFSDKKFCYQMKFMAGLMSMTIINDGEGKGIMLLDAPVMGKRIAVETTKKGGDSAKTMDGDGDAVMKDAAAVDEEDDEEGELLYGDLDSHL